MNTAEIQELFEKAVIPNYTRLPMAIVKGQGSWVWDAEGRKYLDLFPGWGVAGLGHCHPAVTAAVSQQAGTLIHVANNYLIKEQAEFAAILSGKADGRKCFFANSGAEANEGAIKLARLHCEGKHKVVTMLDSFHGRTFGAISATGQPAYQKGFGPIVPGFSYATLNDLSSVEALVDDETCAIMLELVQGEGGVYPCEKEFLQSLRQLCDEKGMLLIFDEVQTAPARLGTWFGYQHFGIQPDLITSAKAIAGGMPLGLIMATGEVAGSLKPGTHASTFGGNSIGCAAGIAAFKAIEEEDMLANIAELGDWLEKQLRDLGDKTGGIKEIRRVGFMLGIELSFPGAQVVENCRTKGLLINCTHESVLRMLPAFNVTRGELEHGLQILGDALTEAVNTET